MDEFKLVHISDDVFKKQAADLEKAIENARKTLEAYQKAYDSGEAMYEINLNDMVKVKLTEYGKEIYRKYFEDVQKYLSCKIEPEIDEKGFTTLQIHELANIFGPAMFIGNIWQVIENNSIYLDLRDMSGKFTVESSISDVLRWLDEKNI